MKIKNVNNQEMASLYEYLGHAAGPDLGKAVAEAAVAAKVPIDTHLVETRTYKGPILRYPVTFLREYFAKNTKTI